MKEGYLYLIPKDDILINKPLPERINSLINILLINRGSFKYNTCYININTSEVEKFRHRIIDGVKIKTYNCLPINTYWFVEETEGI